MLRDLSIRNLLLIESLDLVFEPGLNVLTGETGAGKSILLDSLGFVLGWRGRADLVRDGADQAEVTAVFDSSDAVVAVLDEAGLPVDDDQLVLRRLAGRDGRKRGFVNDRRVSGEVLRAISDRLVEVHGQQDDKGLLDARAHRGMLDEFGALAREREEVAAAWGLLKRARAALAEAEAAAEAAARDADYLTHAAEELADLAPQTGEEAQLDAARREAQLAARIGEDVNRALQAMGVDGAEGRLGDALRWLQGRAGEAAGGLDEPVAALERSLDALAEAASATEALVERMQLDPAELDRLEERLFAIRGLARKHGVQPDELADLSDDLQSKLALIEDADAEIGKLSKAVREAEKGFNAAASDLTAAREEAAKALDAAMAAELGPLKLDAAKFLTEISEADQHGPDGRDRVTFTVSTTPGAAPGPINRIASGGELSRFLLALKVCLRGGDADRAMIFDEIDRGVGGATADAVGRRLASIANGSQVLVVTHSPQVAARGAHHFRVEKSVGDGGTLTTVVPLGAAEREAEIARMLAGDVITDAAQDAARALLNG